VRDVVQCKVHELSTQVENNKKKLKQKNFKNLSKSGRRKMLTRLKKQHKTHHIYTPPIFSLFSPHPFFWQRWMIYLHDFTTFFGVPFSPLPPLLQNCLCSFDAAPLPSSHFCIQPPYPILSRTSASCYIEDPDFVAVKCASKKKPHSVFLCVCASKGSIICPFFPICFVSSLSSYFFQSF
jgi:hypothetical protein